MNERAKAILKFWFDESSPEEHFKKNDDFDKKIRNLFEKDYQNAINNKLENWLDNPKTCLALVILLDQFSRNLFRKNSKAFAMDYKALIIAKNAIDKGYHKTLSKNQILFIFLPFMHSEELDDQLLCSKLIDGYLKDNSNYKEIKKFSKIHLDIIKKFGRFPYRNKVLKRENTTEENEYLNTTHYDFFNI